MADATTRSQSPLPVIDQAVGDSSLTPQQSTAQNPARVANIVRQRRRKNFGSLRHAKDSTEELRRTKGGRSGNSGNMTEPGQVVAIEGEAGGRERNATQYTVGNIASGRIYLRYAFASLFGDVLERTRFADERLMQTGRAC